MPPTKEATEEREGLLRQSADLGADADAAAVGLQQAAEEKEGLLRQPADLRAEADAAARGCRRPRRRRKGSCGSRPT